MRRWYALLLCDDGVARLVKDRRPSRPSPSTLRRGAGPPLSVVTDGAGNRIIGEIDGSTVADVVDDNDPLPAGGVGLIVTEGTCQAAPYASSRHLTA